MTRRGRWGFFAACAGLAVLALPRTDEGPTPPLPVASVARPRWVGPRDVRPRLAVVLEADPRRLAPLVGCGGFSVGIDEAARSELSLHRSPAWTAWLAHPPPIVREVAAVVDVRPGDLASFVAPVDPWAAWDLTRDDRWWELEDRYGPGHDRAPDRRDAEAEASRRAERTERIAESSGDPTLRELADLDRLVAVRFAFVDGNEDPDVLLAALRRSTRPETAQLALEQLCRQDVRLTGEDFDRLRALVAGTTDHAFGVETAAFAARQAWNAGDPDEARRWWPVVDEEQAACLAWGPYGRLADLPGLRTSFADVAEPFTPSGVQRVAERLGAAAAAAPQVDCERFPCVIRVPLARDADGAALDGLARDAFGTDAASTRSSRSGGETWFTVAVPAGLLDRNDTVEVASWRYETVSGWLDDESCLANADLHALRRLRGEPPVTWNEALRVAATDCHAEAPLPPGTHPTLTGRWSDGWTFSPADDPLGACVARRATLAPPPGTEVLLDVTVLHPHGSAEPR